MTSFFLYNITNRYQIVNIINIIYYEKFLQNYFRIIAGGNSGKCLSYYVNYGNKDKDYYLCLYYGVAAKAHLLPIIINPSYRRFDVYANLQLGTKSVIRQTMNDRTSLFVNGGLGVGYNFSKRIGLFYECKYGNSDGMNGVISGGLNNKFGVKLSF